MAKKVKITKGGQTVYPATVMDAVVHPDLRVDSTKLVGEVNVSTIFPTGGIDGGNKYTLETAIAKIPSSLRTAGIKCSFINVEGNLETWTYQGGTFTSLDSWMQGGSGSGGNMILEWDTDVATTRKQVKQNMRKSGLQIGYKDPEKGWVNEQFIGTETNDTQWIKNENWEQTVKQSQIEDLDLKKINVSDIYSHEQISEKVIANNYLLNSDGTRGNSTDSDKLLLYTDISEGDILVFSTIRYNTKSKLAYAFYDFYPSTFNYFPTLSIDSFISGDTGEAEIGDLHQYIVTVPKGALSFVVVQSKNNTVEVVKRTNDLSQKADQIEVDNSVLTNETKITVISNAFKTATVYFRELAPNAKILKFNSGSNKYTLYVDDANPIEYNCIIGNVTAEISSEVNRLDFTTPTANEQTNVLCYDDNLSLKDYAEEQINKISDIAEHNTDTINSYVLGIDKKELELKWLAGGINNSGDYYYLSSPRTKHTIIDMSLYDTIFVTVSNLISLVNGGLTPCFIIKDDEQRENVALSKGVEKSIDCTLYPNGKLYINLAYGETATVSVSKKASSGSSDSGFKNTIQISGDSLVNQLPQYMREIAQSYGYSVTGTAGGGEISLVNLVNMGGLAFMPQNDITIPVSGATVPFKIFANWRDGEGNYRAIKFNNANDGGGCRIKGEHYTITAVTCPYSALALYTDSNEFIDDFTDNGTTIKLSTYPTAKKIRVTINNPPSNVAHLSIDEQDYILSDICTNDGGIQKDTGTFESNSNYKCSDFIDIPSDAQSIYYDALASSDTFTLTRETSGESFIINEADKIYVEKKWTNAKSLHIIFTGQNGGYESDEDYVEQLWAATRQFAYNQFIVVTSYGFPNGTLENGTIMTTPSLAQKMTARFGERYLNLREYFEKQAVNDALRLGYISGIHTADEWKTLFISDGIHPNENGNKLIVATFWNKLLDLSMVTGEYI